MEPDTRGRTRAAKSGEAFRTIGEVARETGIAPHVLRYWESRFPQIRPSRGTGNRRYYRPEDVETLRRIRTLLHDEGYTVEGAVRLLSDAPGQVGEKAPSGREVVERAVAELDAVRRLLAERN